MSQTKSWFQNRICILATMHKKEKVIAPPLEKELEIKVVVPEAFNTDNFGTFTRDIKRLGTQLEAARLKAKKALEITGESLGVTSEGSFFPHPNLPHVACDRELILLVDQVNEIEIIAEEISLETNYSHTSIETVAEALDFAKKVGFPQHGLIVMPSPEPQKNEYIFKGIITENDLINAVNTILKSASQKTAHIETDMRAMYNPTRMQVIAKATKNLINKILNTCPNCGCPGFSIVEYKSGLPCGICRFPTDLILSEIYQCQKCKFQRIQSFPQGEELADPMYCGYCNP